MFGVTGQRAAAAEEEKQETRRVGKVHLLGRKMFQKNDAFLHLRASSPGAPVSGIRRIPENNETPRDFGEKASKKKKKIVQTSEKVSELQSGRFDGECEVNPKVSDYDNFPV